MSRLTYVVKNMIVINVLVHIAIFLMPSLNEVAINGALFFVHSPLFQPFQIVTSMFMHGGFGHLFMNMLGLFFLGPMVESVLGSKRFLILYLLAGLGGTLLHTAYNYFKYLNLLNQNCADINCQAYYDLMATPALGASGCVFGVVIAFAMMFPKEKLIIFPIPIPIKASYMAIGLVIISLFFGITDTAAGGIAHFAHLGGAIVGFIMIRYWNMAKLR